MARSRGNLYVRVQDVEDTRTVQVIHRGPGGKRRIGTPLSLDKSDPNHRDLTQQYVLRAFASLGLSEPTSD